MKCHKCGTLVRNSSKKRKTPVKQRKKSIKKQTQPVRQQQLQQPQQQRQQQKKVRFSDNQRQSSWPTTTNKFGWGVLPQTSRVKHRKMQEEQSCSDDEYY